MTESSTPEDPFPRPPEAPPHPRHRRRTAIVAIAALGTLLLGGALVVALKLGGEAGNFTLSDGTFSMTLPAEWEDQTEDYFNLIATDERFEDVGIEGAVSLDGVRFVVSDNTLSMSAYPRTSIDPSGSDLLAEVLDYWEGVLEDSRDRTSERFTTDAGDEVWFGTLTGEYGVYDWGTERVVVAVVVGEDDCANFQLVIRPAYYSAEDDLLEAIKTLRFHD